MVYLPKITFHMLHVDIMTSLTTQGEMSSHFFSEVMTPFIKFNHLICIFHFVKRSTFRSSKNCVYILRCKMNSPLAMTVHTPGATMHAIDLQHHIMINTKSYQINMRDRIYRYVYMMGT